MNAAAWTALLLPFASAARHKLLSTMSRQYSCGPATVDFTNTTPPNQCTAGGDEYLWTVSYSDPEGCANAGDPTYAFANGTTGHIKISFIVFYCGRSLYYSIAGKIN